MGNLVQNSTVGGKLIATLGTDNKIPAENLPVEEPLDLSNLTSDSWNGVVYDDFVKQTPADATYYVNAATGNDTTGTGTSGAPWKTIQKAIDAVSGFTKYLGTVIHINIAAGDYSAEDLWISGIVGDGALFLDGPVTTGTTHTVNSVGINRSTARITVRGLNAIGTGYNGIYVTDCVHVDLQHMNVTTADTEYSCVSVENSNVYIQNSTFSNRWAGIMATAGAKVMSWYSDGTGNKYGYYVAQGGEIERYGGALTGDWKDFDDGGIICDTVPSKTTATLTYYVDAALGNDSNTGTAASPFATIGKATSMIPNIVNHAVTINVIAGTYPESVSLSGKVGSSSITINGGTTVSSSYNVTAFTVTNCCLAVTLKGFNATTTTTAGFTVYRSPYVQITYCQAASSTASYDGVTVAYGTAYVDNSVISNRHYALVASTGGMLYSYLNSGTNNLYGIYAYGGWVVKRSTTVPSGTTAEGGVNYGGQITETNGTATTTLSCGSIIAVAGTTVPLGYLECNGASVSRTTYANLFSKMVKTVGDATSISIATPGVVTLTAHGLITGDAVFLTTTGALPTGLSTNTMYYVKYFDVNAFQLATTYANAIAGTVIATSGTTSGTHTVYKAPFLVASGSTFNLPDFRGEFLRGWDNGKGTDTGRPFGAAQVGTIVATTGYTYRPYIATNVDSESSASVSSGMYMNSGSGTAGTVYSGTARPRNIAVMYCIKY